MSINKLFGCKFLLNIVYKFTVINNFIYCKQSRFSLNKACCDERERSIISIWSNRQLLCMSGIFNHNDCLDMTDIKYARRQEGLRHFTPAVARPYVRQSLRSTQHILNFRFTSTFVYFEVL